jgi:hypothetical protein
MTGSNDFRRGVITLSRRSRAIVREYGQRLGTLHARRPFLVGGALRDYASSYWSSFGCPVYKGYHSAQRARRVLNLLGALQVPQIRVICFAAPDSWIASRWERLLGWPRARMTFRRPPNGASPAAQKWIAIDALFPVGAGESPLFKASRGFSVLMLASDRLIRLDQRTSERHPQADEPGDQEGAL